jgi:hypothetical protein
MNFTSAVVILDMRLASLPTFHYHSFSLFYFSEFLHFINVIRAITSCFGPFAVEFTMLHIYIYIYIYIYRPGIAQSV